MRRFKQHTVESAPEESREILRGVKRGLGFVPSLYAVLAGAPAALRSYVTMGCLLDQSSLTPEEMHVVLLTTSVEHGSAHCVAAHSTIAEEQQLCGDLIRCLRERRTPQDPRLAALQALTTALIRTRGRVPQDELDRFYAAGFEPPQVLEVITGIALKTLSNYVNHVAERPLEEPFARGAWTPADPAKDSDAE